MLSKLVAVGISAQIMGVRAQDGLLEYLLEGTSTFVLFRAYNVAKALGDIGDEKSMNILVELTGTHFRDAYIETDSKTRAAAAEALGKVAGRLKNRTEIEKAESALVELLKDQNPGLRAYAGLALGQIIDNHAAKPLIAALKDSDPLVRSTAALGLAGSLDRIKVEPLIAALGAADADMRANAAKGLMGGTGEDPRALAALIGCQKDPAAAVRSAAVQSLLGFAKEQGVFEHLLLCLKDGDPGVRSSALLVLGLMGERAIEPLINGFKDADAKVRSQAVTHMSKFKDPRVVNTICEGLKDQDPVVRLTCVLSLSENGTPQAADGLAFALNDPVEIVRQEAARVMEKRKTVPGKDSRKTDREAK
jgi:HEAT repeat protein